MLGLGGARAPCAYPMDLPDFDLNALLKSRKTDILPVHVHPYSSTRIQAGLGWTLNGTKRIRRAMIGGSSSRSSAM